ncbi:MAG: cyclic 2,3-diphosphoglycerate synthase [Anaerolineae bacterium]|nr:MAG: cyclic 2,3-diphosphoglycerate synthase [Anaerolineae bacterium]
MEPDRVLIMGAAGRDFHNFNVYFRDNPAYEVVAFTATQIPNIEDRTYPAELAGEAYPSGIPIYPEDQLEALIESERISQVVFAYSDITHTYVMHIASRVLVAGADFRLMGLGSTLIESSKPVVSVCAARTGSGKSQTSRKVAAILRELGHKLAVVRHPMPYGDLKVQAVQRFASREDLDRYACSIEEREEYEPHLAQGAVVYAGVDYEAILREAEKEADIILWDGGNNDLPFFRSDLWIVVVDPHRPGHELRYHPGEANVRAADLIVINKIDTAAEDDIETVRKNVATLNPEAEIIEAASPIQVDDPDAIRGKRVLVVEDGPTLTHGGMAFGAGWIAARRYGAEQIVDPRPYALGILSETYAKYPTTGAVLPAMGYGSKQMEELEKTINSADADVVIIGTPIDLGHLLDLNKPYQNVRYDLEEIGQPRLPEILEEQFGRGPGEA